MYLGRFLVLLALLSLGSGCQKSPKEHADKQLLHISFHNEVRSLDPRIGIDYPSAFAIKMLFEGLMLIDIDGKVKPALAQSFEISDDHKTYTFHLRPSFWSNGDKVTAYDFEYTWKRVVDPHGASLGVHNYYPIKNVRSIIRGEKPLDSVGIKALDAKTLAVELEHPTPYFLEVLATTAFFPVNAKVDQENDNWPNTDGKDFVCNGPFSLKRHSLENEIIIEKNPHYWDAKNVRLAGIQIAIIRDPITQLNLYEKKQLDWVGKPLSKMPLDAIHFFKQKGELSYFPTLGLYWYFLNTETLPFNNKKMRQAFAYAVNREAITDHLLQTQETPAMGVLPYSLTSQKGGFFADNNTELAKRLFNEALDELGLSKKDLPKIKINYSAAPVHMVVAEALQEQWNRVFDLNIKLEGQDWKTHYGKIQKGNFQIGGMYWQSWLRDPSYILQSFLYKSDGVNMSRWENTTYKDLFAASEEEIDLEKRNEIFHKAETLLMEEMPVIPVYFNTIAYMKNEKLKNVYISELYEVDFRWSYFDE